MKSSVIRPLTGLAMVVSIAAIIALAISLFRGSWADTVPVTVIADRAGLVMNPDAKVKMRGVQVGRVSSIEPRPDGTAALHLAVDRSALNLIPDNVTVDITSSTVFGAKFVQLVPPPTPSSGRLRPGQEIPAQHVMVEVNTVFQKLVNVLDKIDPAQLNETLGAIATAFNGRGDQIGQTLVDLNAVLAELEPSLPNLAHDIETSVPMLTAYGDAAPDLVDTVRHSTQIGNSIVDQQRNLDRFLVSTIGLADAGNDVIGGNTDPYQPVERELRITRAVLEVCAEFNQPVGIITKSALIERDLDLLAPMAAKGLAHAFVSVTTLDAELARRLEPRASAPYRRLKALRRLAEAGVPCGVMVAPVIPFLNDQDMETILEAAREAGVQRAGYVVLRLPHELKDLFQEWLAQHYPLRAERVMARVRDMRGGMAYNSRWRERQTGTGTYAELLAQRFDKACRRLGLNARSVSLDTSRFKVPGRAEQMELF